MFDFLKKKIGGFIDGLTKKEDEKPPEAPKEEEQEGIPETPEEAERIETEPAGEPEIQEAPQKLEAVPEPVKAEGKEAAEKEKTKAVPQKPVEEKSRAPGSEAGKQKTPRERFELTNAQGTKRPSTGFEPLKKKESGDIAPARPEPAKKPEPIKAEKEPEMPREEEPTFIREIAKEAKIPEKPPEPPPEPAKIPSEKPKERIKLGIVGTVKSMITREVEISEKDVGDMLDSLELELLEADVDLTVAEGIKEELSGKLIGARVGKGELHSFVGGAIKETLIGVLSNEKAFDIAERAESAEKPLKIAFLGINGAGKTTTIAKVAKLLMERKKKVVFAAADTFRAAAIEQMGVHAERLGVKVIKRDYGSDPTSVAYDAVNFARAHGVDAVLIDTAGRQDTNISLMNEMKKLDRVIKPDIKIYVGESIAGNAMIEQVSAFNREIGIDAIILTKLDCDPKGGTMLSISRITGIPIIYVGVGQGYDALEKFDPRAIVERIVE